MLLWRWESFVLNFTEEASIIKIMSYLFPNRLYRADFPLESRRRERNPGSSSEKESTFSYDESSVTGLFLLQLCR